LEILKRDINDKPLLFFKIETAEANGLGSFFCRTQGELAIEISKRLKKKDIILLEGFLQKRRF